MPSELGTDVALRDRSDDPAAIEDFLRLEAASVAFKIAFDERYRRAAPGVQLIYANRDAFYASGRRLFDSCAAPDSEVVNRTLPHRRPMATLVIAPTGVRGALARGAARAAATMHARRHERSALRKKARAG